MLALIGERLGFFGVDHQWSIDARLLLKPRMAVIPIRAVLPDLEAIDIHAVGRNAIKAQPRHAVHVGRQDDAVPVNGRGFVETVFYPQGDGVALAPAQQWAWNAAVDGHRGSGIAGDIDLGFADGQVELGAGQPVRLARIRERPRRAAPEPQPTQNTAGGKPFHEGAS